MIWFISAFALVLIVAVMSFFYSPLGLGRAPANVLPDSFFKKPAKSLSDLGLLIDGKEAFSAVLKLIENAKEYVIVQAFIWRDDDIGRKVASALVSAADRGAKVTARKDMAGTFFEYKDMFRGRPSPAFSDRRLRRHPNIHVELSFAADTDHSKYYIADGRRVIFGGMNIADEYRDLFHDYMVQINSDRWAEAFERKVAGRASWPSDAPFYIAVNDRHVCEIGKAVLEALEAAKENVILEHAYISDKEVMKGIISAARRGVDITIILPEAPDRHAFANKFSVNHLLAACPEGKLNVYLYPGMSHAKAGLVDSGIAMIGSANLTHRSLKRSREVALFANGAHDEPFISKLRERLREDIKTSKKVTKPFPLSFVAKARALVDRYTW